MPLTVRHQCHRTVRRTSQPRHKTSPAARRATGFTEPSDSFADDTLNRRETLELVRAYYRITDASVRKRVFDLIKSLTPENPDA